MYSKAVLLVEQNQDLRSQWRSWLRRAGLQTLEVSGLLHLPPATDFDVAVIGSGGNAPEASLPIVRGLLRQNHQIRVIFAPQRSTAPLAVAAFREHVTDYLEPPVSESDLLTSIRRCRPVCEPHEPRCPNGFAEMIGESEPMRKVRSSIERFAPTDSNVLITGESGTGKELAARIVHRLSLRRNKPFVVINCAAVPDSLLESELFGYEKGSFTGAESRQPGKLQAADGGTVLLDEIGDMSLQAQTKILRLVETKEIQSLGTRVPGRIDIRFIAATNQKLEELSAEGRFRRDLFFRLNVVRLHLPPLRQRPGDVPLLLHRGLARWNSLTSRAVQGFHPEAWNTLMAYDWPGNVRELNNLIETSFAMCSGDHLTVDHLWNDRDRQTYAESDFDERERVLSVLVSCNWNKSKAAQKLSWSRMTLYRKLEKYQLERPRAAV